MSIREFSTHVRNYTLIGAMLLLSWFLSTRFSGALSVSLHDAPEGAETLIVLSGIVIVFALGFIIYELAKPTRIPSFVLAIFFGLVSRDTLSFLTDNPQNLMTLVIIGAILILFEGGLETPFTKFRSLLSPILSLAFVGTIINAFLFSLTLQYLGSVMGMSLPLPAVILLGAALSSTDPAAIIPSFQTLIFTRPKVKHIAVSESAINDVVGAMLVGVFLVTLSGTVQPASVVEAYATLMTTENLMGILRLIFIGGGVGIFGFGILHLWNHWKSRVQSEDGTDAALFLAVPLFCFLLSSTLGGSGYLSVFLCGLFFHLRSHVRHVEHYFNQTIEGFMKPMIFMLLGAMVNPADLLSVAGIGILSGLIFMIVLRPLIVLISLLPFAWSRQRFTLNELLFLSFVRETGVIPAMLLISIRLSGIEGGDNLVAIGLWVILLTLVVEPPLTPLLACKLKIAKNISDSPQRKHVGPVAVLCSRGFSFPERMQTVVEWTQNHGVDNIALLHCPEDKYGTEFVDDVKKRAEDLFKAINKRLSQEGKKGINFEFLCGPGLLQDNIEALIESGDVSIIFVGTKMLDYRLEDVKRLNTPFFFMQ